MPDCDICGKPAVTSAIVEGARLSVCERCVSYGRELAPKAAAFGRKTASRPPAELEVIEDYGKIVVQARERAGMSRQGLARKLFVFESVLSRVEEGKLKPSVELSKKLEESLGITLLEERKPEQGRVETIRQERHQGRGLTLADVVSIKKKQPLA